MKHNNLFRVLGLIFVAGLFGSSLLVLPALGLPYQPLSEISQDPYLPMKTLQVLIYAGDNLREEPDVPSDLTQYHPATIQELIAASEDEPNKTSVVLVDLDGIDDTHISIISNGVETQVNGLPDVNGMLTPASEYDMTDGEHLGGFLKWTLDNYADTNTKTSLSFYGHGTFLAPEIDLGSIFTGNEEMAELSRQDIPLFPMPHIVGAFPNFTDVHPEKALITPYAIRQMLEIGTSDGANPIEVLDLTHCFALSLEEIYEISNDGGTQYADMIVGSANYAYFGPSMPAKALTALNPDDDAATMATDLMTAYEDEIALADLNDGNPDVDYPRTLAVIDSAALTGIKLLFDEIAVELMSEFAADPVGTVAKLQSAAQNSPSYYDTTYCTEDFALEPSDGLRDVGAFLTQLRVEFGLSSEVGIHAEQARVLLAGAVIERATANGIPSFVTSQTPMWAFDQSNTLGISIYADLIGETDPDNDTIRNLSWHAIFYTDDSVTETGIDNPHPYRFITGENVTWADVMPLYWETRTQAEGLTVKTEACLTELPVIPAGSYSLELYAGWNLVSLPLTPDDTAIAAVLSEIAGKYNRVATYQNGTWLLYNPASPFNELNELDGQIGFWIYMTEPATLTVIGGTTSTPIALNDGWNLVSYPSIDGAPIADSLSLYAFSGTLQMIQRFDAQTDTWRVYQSNSPFNDFSDFTSGMGYWIHVSD